MLQPILGVSYRIVSATFVSGKTQYYVHHVQVRQLLTGRITHDERAPALPAECECRLIVQVTGGC